jgi:hypothetical protein
MKNDQILRRISTLLSIEDIDKKIASLPAKDFQSLLLFIFEEKARGWSIKEMFEQYLTSRFTGHSSIPQKKLTQMDNLAFSILPQVFETVEFAPVVPFGTNSLLASTNQKNVMSTVRNLEVIADPTTALALECAKRRGKLADPQFQVHISTSHRCIRMQNFDKIPGFIPHFRIFALASSAKIEEPLEFEIEMIVEHLKYYLRLLDIIPTALDCRIVNISVTISNIGIAEYLIHKHGVNRIEIGGLTQDPSFSLFRRIGVDTQPKIVCFSGEQFRKAEALGIEIYLQQLEKIHKKIDSEIKPLYPKVNFDYDLERVAGIGYYENLCLRITAENRQGHKFPLIDGGSTNWLKKLLTSKKERFFISGMGTELLCQSFCS